MRVVVTSEERYVRTPDGAVWTMTGPAYRFWQRYLSAFDRVRIVARVRDVTAAPVDASRVDGPAVEVWPVPHYVGPAQYARRRAAIARALTTAVDDTDAVILRVPSNTAAVLVAERTRRDRPFALEVVGDPYDVLAPGVVRHPLRPLLRRWFVMTLRNQCRSAVAVSYVTERTMQARYPADAAVTTIACSSVELAAEAFGSGRTVAARPPTAAAIVSVGSLEQLYKGVDTLIEALAILAAVGPAPRLVHVGGGRCLDRLVRLATRLGVADRVDFVGSLPPGAAIRQRLDAADLFVMPSRTEGLPRALIEAMARGLPAIATRVGGIPELLPAEDLVDPGDPAALADAVSRMLADPARMAAASARNLHRARDFAADTLTPRRDAYYQAVRQLTARGVALGSPSR